ncbi:tRNA lysidine(34) synthetase TilS [Salinibacterium sp. dk2585]|uniref:tRNA lysidine(34) synthetase TilS n=1 Tax=unclassified Salinibacterium TaxID=2632331 RepID=UPI0011C255E5|nr:MULTISPECIES: tRNA lysidine(34) synthetase TilS [unclassified Salinibacterium]QEE60533.1 tRNA lysidine(34) synthetase TilS [Salinibacterium sp. dk2585]TXK55605.1 tRNA lysidine(34) synthetase TilS [Salinibacterium sp. dk5596]
MHARRPRLTPAIADTRRAVRECLDGVPADALVLVGLSGGADSLALAAATAFEAPRAGLRAGAIIVDHGLQHGSADVAAQAARTAEQLGLDPVVVRRVEVAAHGSPEAAAREARYGAFAATVGEHGASALLLGHTLDDQAETVLLGLARGAGARSLAGMAARGTLAMGPNADAREPHSGTSEDVAVLRPLLGITRAETEQACTDADLEPWNDPHNADPAYARVRARRAVLPVLERELGPGIAQALARSAEQLREDADALDHFAEEQIEELAEHAEAGLSLPVRALEANPPALRHRLIRLVVSAEFGVWLSRTHTLEVARLVSDWKGQGELHVPGVRVERRGARIFFSAAARAAEGAGTAEHTDENDPRGQ